VYGEDFHVNLGEGSLQGPSVQAHDQHANTNIVRRRKNLTEKERHDIYEELLLMSNNGKLKKTSTTVVAQLFNVNRCQVQTILREAKKCRAAGVPVNLSSKRKQACGPHKVQIDLSQILTIPLNMRTTLKSLAEALGVKKTTLYRLFKAGKLRRHTNTIKPCLRDDNKRERLKYCVAMVDALSVSSESKFIDMKNIIHIDEKWFNTTKKAKKFYMLPEEEDPLRTI
jgi:AraC-like DNA-binding protein